MAKSLIPNYAEAQEVLFTDDRIKATWVDYDSPGGTSGSMRGYLVEPEGDGPFPAVLVMHENRGLNPYIQDVARRFAAADSRKVKDIRAALQVHYAVNDERVNARRPDYEAAFAENDVTYEMHVYPGTRHGFHNYSTPRYDAEAAQLAWTRMVAFFHEHLG
ncbi:dienelactone hydrolase family protein [Congregibacter sp.]|uniref:dienelactone hydrolase family protein n=1 Tax=Congregibacter sp. TaxID=2744308 RepID=UPI003F6C3B51